MAERAPKLLQFSDAETSGREALRKIAAELKIRPHKTTITRLLKEGKIRGDIVDQHVLNDGFVLQFFGLTATQVEEAIAKTYLKENPTRAAARKRKKKPVPTPAAVVPPRPKEPAETPAKPALPVASEPAPPEAPAASEEPAGDGESVKGKKAKKDKKDKEKKEPKRDGIVKRVGKSALGVVAAGAISTMFDTSSGGFGSTLLSGVQEKLDRNKMNNPTGATRKDQPKGFEPKHILAPLAGVLSEMTKNQALLLDAMNKKSEESKSASSPTVTYAPATATAGTEAADEAGDYRVALMERLISIDENVASLVKVKESGKEDKKKEGLWKKILGWVGILSTAFAGFKGWLKRIPYLGKMFSWLGEKMVWFKNIIVDAAKGVWTFITRMYDKLMEGVDWIVKKVKNIWPFGKDAAEEGAEAAAKKGAESATKAVAGEGAEAVAKAAGGEAAEIAAKGAAKSALKAAPLLGVGLGLGFGAHRAMEGDLLGAAGEVLSGLLSLVPVVGTAASLGVSGALVIRDIKKAGEKGGAADITPAQSVTMDEYGRVESFGAANADMKAAQSSAPVVISTNSTVNNAGDQKTMMTPFAGHTNDRGGDFLERLSKA
jgi:hypothetical protein